MNVGLSDIPNLPVLTLDQANVVLTKLSDGYCSSENPEAYVFLVRQPIRQSNPQINKLLASPKKENDSNDEQNQILGLARLRERVIDRIPKLVTFYLMGCAYSDGCRSLRAVARQLEKMDIAGTLPEKGGSSLTYLWKTINELQREIFFYHFGERSVQLFHKPGKGKPDVLSDDGWRAWEDTRQYLDLYYTLPDWSKISSATDRT